MLPRFFIAALACAYFGGPIAAEGMDQYDWVIVIAERTELRIGKRLIGTLPRGELRTINRIQDGWYWVRGTDDDWAWINARDVIPREQGIRYFSEAIRKRPAASDYNIRGQLWSWNEHDRAIADFNEAIRREPDQAAYYRERGLRWSLHGDLDRAIADFGEAIRLAPDDVSNYALRASRWVEKGDYDSATLDYDQIIRIDPDNLTAYTERGRAWVHKGELDRALGDFNEVLRHDPIEIPDVLVFAERANVWLANANEERASQDYEEAIRRTASNPWAREFPFMYRAEAMLRAGRYEQTLTDCDELIGRNPIQAGAYAMSAWVRATCPDARYRDGAKAVEYGTKAVELSRDKTNPDRPAILAAAYAEAGDFERARQWQSKAIARAPANEKGCFQNALKQYEAGKPIREAIRDATTRPRLYFETFIQ